MPSRKPISLSASGIKDYMECPLRWWYRRNLSGEAEPSPELTVGLAVHNAIDKHWNDEKAALKYAMAEVKHLEPVQVLKTQRMLNSFRTHFISYLSPEDESEVSFYIPLKKFEGQEVVVRGRIDRILKTGQVFDWKTTAKPPRSIDNDVQFMLYYWAYRERYKKAPTGVYYASLAEGKLITYHHNENLLQALLKKYIPEMLTCIVREQFPPLGLFNDKCYWCQFREVCHKDLGVGKEDRDELVRSIFSE